MFNKKICFLILSSIILCTHAFAYEIKTNDIKAYTFTDWEQPGKEQLFKSTYEINEENMIIIEKTAISKKDNIDYATLGEKTKWKIANIDGENIQATRYNSVSEDFISFHNDGTFVFFQINHLSHLSHDVNKENKKTISSLWFGKWEKVK